MNPPPISPKTPDQNNRPRGLFDRPGRRSPRARIAAHTRPIPIQPMPIDTKYNTSTSNSSVHSSAERFPLVEADACIECQNRPRLRRATGPHVLDLREGSHLLASPPRQSFLPQCPPQTPLAPAFRRRGQHAPTLHIRLWRNLRAQLLNLAHALVLGSLKNHLVTKTGSRHHHPRYSRSNA